VSSAFSVSAAAKPPRLTFNKDVAPIIWSRCATCHRPGEIGPFSLITYADVKRRASQIAAVTAKRIMPPWKPEPGAGDFEGARRLTDRELQTIQQWIAQGAVEGKRANLPPAPEWNTGWQLGTPDAVARMPAPYAVPAAGADVFRTFVIPIPVDRPRYVRAIEFRPGNPRVVHHASLGVDRTRSSRLLDDRDPEPGYAGGMVPDARYPEGHLLGWTPGQAPHAVPSGMAWRLEPDSDLVAQLHLQPTGKPETLEVSVGFFFTDDAPTRTPVGLRLGSETIDIPPGAREYIVSDEYVLPVDADVIAIQPHAHNLARRTEARAILPDGRSELLIAIADWDFRWQDVYRYAKPLVLPQGTRIAMRYTYDNSEANVRNPHRPPARVVWGQNTSDEMGDLWIQLAARRNADYTTLNEDVQRKRSAEDLAAYTKLLAADSGNPLRHDAVASLYLDLHRLDEAIAHFRESLALNPQSASTHYNLGYALTLRGNRDRRAVAHEDLVRGAGVPGDLNDAEAHFREALRLDPAYAQAHNNLGALLQVKGRIDEARNHFREAVALRPDNVEARANLGQLLSAEKQERAAVEQFRAALAAREDHPQALVGLAWIEATSNDPSLRDPADAVRLAERAAAATGRKDLPVLDTLAATYAAAGRFDAAVAAAQEAIDIAQSQGLTALAARLRERLALYKQRKIQN
jgi:tetratricopeptide (TPR) repeat protein